MAHARALERLELRERLAQRRAVRGLGGLEARLPLRLLLARELAHDAEQLRVLLLQLVHVLEGHEVRADHVRGGQPLAGGAVGHDGDGGGGGRAALSALRLHLAAEQRAELQGDVADLLAERRVLLDHRLALRLRGRGARALLLELLRGAVEALRERRVALQDPLVLALLRREHRRLGLDVLQDARDVHLQPLLLAAEALRLRVRLLVRLVHLRDVHVAAEHPHAALERRRARRGAARLVLVLALLPLAAEALRQRLLALREGRLRLLQLARRVLAGARHRLGALALELLQVAAELLVRGVQPLAARLELLHVRLVQLRQAALRGQLALEGRLLRGGLGADRLQVRANGLERAVALGEELRRVREALGLGLRLGLRVARARLEVDGLAAPRRAQLDQLLRLGLELLVEPRVVRLERLAPLLGALEVVLELYRRGLRTGRGLARGGCAVGHGRALARPRGELVLQAVHLERHALRALRGALGIALERVRTDVLLAQRRRGRGRGLLPRLGLGAELLHLLPERLVLAGQRLLLRFDASVLAAQSHELPLQVAEALFHVFVPHGGAASVR